MKKYLYYPGCSLEGTAREYDLSTRALFSKLGVELIELADWTCCGASAAEATDHMLSLVMPARNLALAEAEAANLDLLVPCSACYLNLKKARETATQNSEARNRINQVLSVEGLQVSGSVQVRHLLDVLANDFGADAIASRVVRTAPWARVAPYYGCQCLRPYTVFDDPERPVSMDALIRATGADIFHWHAGGRCCSGSILSTAPDVGLQRVGRILQAAKGASAVATVCPMCQMNLEAYQGKAGRRLGEDLAVTVLYLPQLLGWAMGIDESSLGMHMNLAVQPEFRRQLQSSALPG